MGQLRCRARLLAGLGLAGLAAALSATSVAVAAEGPPRSPDTREVMFVGNNWEGTADIVDPRTFTRLTRVNVIPDLQERLAEIYANPVDLGYFLGIRELVGEGHDQFVDDMFSSHDGRFVYVSRPSLKDVVGIHLATRKIVWRVPVEGQRADHMAISPDGTRLAVSASTANKVHIIDPREGKLVGEFASGDSPHENNYSRDGKRIFHASIGLVYTPADQPGPPDSTKGDRWFQVVDAQTNQILKRLDIGKIMEAHGHEGYSSAVRPMAIAPGERIFYFQLSFLHGFVEFDIDAEKPLRIANLPVSEEAKKLSREEYLLDSAHHGLAIDSKGKKLCVAGTMSDYGAIVSRATFAYKLFDVGKKPYWATNSGDGKQCWLSSSGDDQVVVLDYRTEKLIAKIPVGDHPQRVRVGVIRRDLPGLPPAPGAKPRLVRDCVANGRLRMEVLDPDYLVRYVDFKLGDRQIAKRDAKRPFRRTVSAETLSKAGGARLRAVVRRANGRTLVLARPLPRCG